MYKEHVKEIEKSLHTQKETHKIHPSQRYTLQLP